MLLAELPAELATEVQGVLDQLEPQPELPRPSARRARRERAPIPATEPREQRPTPWRRCTQCRFYGGEIILGRDRGAARILKTCPDCGAPPRHASPEEIFDSLPVETQGAIADALAEVVVQHIIEHGLSDVGE